jgi:hypothetical protein
MEMNMVELGHITVLRFHNLILRHIQMVDTGIITVISMEMLTRHPRRLGDATMGQLPDD